jgi:UDP-glucose 4-epimerase
MKIILTGVAGLLGCHFARHLLKKGHTVVGIDNLSGGYKDFLPENEKFSFFKYDLGADTDSRELINNTFRQFKPEVVYHFAAYAAEGLSPFIRNYNYVNNVLSSVNLINACVEYDCKLIFTSSMAVYGQQTPPFREDMRPDPIDPYGIAKYAVEMDLKQAHQQFKLQYNIVRPHNVLGTYQNIWDRYRNVIGIFIRRALNNESIRVYGDGNQTRAFSDISYYMEPFEKLIDGHNGETFNIGADKYWSINEVALIVQKVASKHGYNARIEHVEPRHEVKHAYCDHSKAKEHLKFKDETNLELLIEEVFSWAIEQPNREVKDLKYELTKDIYSYWK